MRQVLRLDWPVSRNGYEILEIDRKKVEWTASPPEYEVTPPTDATEAERKLLKRWGMHLAPYEGEPNWEKVRVIEQKGHTSRSPNVMANSPAMFVDFANIDNSEDRLLEFVKQYGLPRTDGPTQVDDYLYQAKQMQLALQDWQSFGSRNPERWLSKHANKQPTGFGDGQFHLTPQIIDGKLCLVLLPNNLMVAMWVQLFQQVAHEAVITNCESCGNMIVTGVGGSRSHRRFCSNACRQREQRKRDKERKAVAKRKS